MEHFADFQSSNISKLTYDLSRQVLEVEFHNGSVYQYFEVGEGTWTDFKNAPSKGQFIHQHLKGKFRYAKV